MRADADPQTVQILASARRLLGDPVELHPLTSPYAHRRSVHSINLAD
ncbi:hypothetical protein Q8W71_26970 [Methylobacterium sp. NEAU 140]|nr:hypothetical protein [Methylobacterium sp. NEAU 140]MDP4026274.1 hypothetical protein [Methylobacterium sp. NEAU 140]